MTPADLRTWQASMCFTQGQAAKALGMGLSNYSNLVNGARRHTGKPIEQLDRRTELACLALSAGIGQAPV